MLVPLLYLTSSFVILVVIPLRQHCGFPRVVGMVGWIGRQMLCLPGFIIILKRTPVKTNSYTFERGGVDLIGNSHQETFLFFVMLKSIFFTWDYHYLRPSWGWGGGICAGCWWWTTNLGLPWWPWGPGHPWRRGGRAGTPPLWERMFLKQLLSIFDLIYESAISRFKLSRLIFQDKERKAKMAYSYKSYSQKLFCRLNIKLLCLKSVREVWKAVEELRY